MENKWFVFQEGDGLHFHRSWTGILVYRVTVTAGRLHGVAFNAEQFNGTDEEAADEPRAPRRLAGGPRLGDVARRRAAREPPAGGGAAQRVLVVPDQRELRLVALPAVR